MPAPAWLSPTRRPLCLRSEMLNRPSEPTDLGQNKAMTKSSETKGAAETLPTALDVALNETKPASWPTTNALLAERNRASGPSQRRLTDLTMQDGKWVEVGPQTSEAIVWWNTECASDSDLTTGEWKPVELC